MFLGVFALTVSLSLPDQCLFLIFYGFGCELWAAPSEEFGRWPILQASLLLTNSASPSSR